MTNATRRQHLGSVAGATSNLSRQQQARIGPSVANLNQHWPLVNHARSQLTCGGPYRASRVWPTLCKPRSLAAFMNADPDAWGSWTRAVVE